MTIITTVANVAARTRCDANKRNATETGAVMIEPGTATIVIGRVMTGIAAVTDNPARQSLFSSHRSTSNANSLSDQHDPWFVSMH